MSKIFVFLCNPQYREFFSACCKDDIDIVFKLPSQNGDNKVEYFSKDLSDKYISIVYNSIYHKQKKTTSFHISFTWDPIWDYLKKNIWPIYCNVESFYLCNAIEAACDSTITTIIVGSSYAKYGINPSCIHTPAINLGLSSQDIYYSCKIAQKVIKSNKSIKNVVLPTAYYTFYSDLSRANSAYAREVVATTYVRALGDSHHATNLPLVELQLPEQLWFLDAEKTYAYLCREEFWKRQGKSAHLLRTFEEATWTELYRFPRTEAEKLQLSSSQKQYYWEQLPADVRATLGYKRAQEHNKLYQHTNTEVENIKLFDDFVTFCNMEGVNLHVLLMPQTTEYIRGLNPNFQSQYFQALDSAKGNFYFTNYLDTTLFTAYDFSDPDHLNENGAEKVSTILNEILESG